MPPFQSAIDALSPFKEGDIANVIVETPAGYRAKINYEPGTGLLTLGKFLPEGFAFPFDFGFIPGTLAEDGDPVDVMVVAETGTAPGCLVHARLLGVLKISERNRRAGQHAPLRNDRLLAVPLASRRYADLARLDAMPAALREQIEYFLTSYGTLEGKELEVLGMEGPEEALRIVRDAARKA